ncbi:MAG: sugar ABC transporter ATP-binding protein [Actinomycetota bacterium]|nr:sugar ABC transporter ATP-binding protein [Actinomycetota bacterium]
MVQVPPLVVMSGISKRFGGVIACEDVHITVLAGEVHALLGENGAGKSTLMRILSGDITEFDGAIEIGGSRLQFSGPADAQAAGIAMISQELDLVPGLSVSDNILLGREPRTRLRWVDRRRIQEQVRSLLASIGVRLDPGCAVERLRSGEQQLVAIAKAFSLRARVLIMDEPTSALSSAEVDRLFHVTRQLRREGVGVVYISHRMDEITKIADRATVLRDGRVVSTFNPERMTTAEVVESMVGRPVQAMFPNAPAGIGEELLRVEGLRVRPKHRLPGRREPDGISFCVRAGEIIGLAGLLGSGRTELLETLFGAGAVGEWAGHVLLGGREFCPRGPRDALRGGVAFVPEDRRTFGLVLFHSIVANTVLASVKRMSRMGIVSSRTERSVTVQAAGRLRIRLTAVNAPVGNLSGGSQQKVVLARSLLTQPRLLLLDEPTRGVDIETKAEIYALLGELAGRGLGVLLASSELPELIGICSRVVVLHCGRSVVEFGTESAAEADVLAAMMAGKDESDGQPVGGPRAEDG